VFRNVVFLKLCNQTSSQFFYFIFNMDSYNVFGKERSDLFLLIFFMLKMGRVIPVKPYKTEETVTRCLLPTK